MPIGSMYENGTYLARNPTWHAEDSPWKAKQIINMLRRNHVKPTTVCEIGCGAGEILRCLADEYGGDVDFSGYEISPQAYEICKEKERPNLHFLLENLVEREAAIDRAFDLVLVIDVIEHIEDCFGFLRQMRTKGEFKLFHIPLDVSVESVLLGFILDGRASAGHIHYFTKESALAALHDTGYSIIDSCHTCGYIDLPHPRWKDNLLKIPRGMFFALHQDWAARIMGRCSLLVLAK